MAGALLTRRLKQAGLDGEVQVSSAGTWARDGEPPAENGRKLMAELGEDIGSDRSRIVTAPMLAEADLILTMENGHKEALWIEFPETAGRVFLLSEMSGKKKEIRDPFGGSLKEYRETMNEIAGYIEQGFDQILAAAGQNHARRG